MYNHFKIGVAKPLTSVSRVRTWLSKSCINSLQNAFIIMVSKCARTNVVKLKCWLENTTVLRFKLCVSRTVPWEYYRSMQRYMPASAKTKGQVIVWNVCLWNSRSNTAWTQCSQLLNALYTDSHTNVINLYMTRRNSISILIWQPRQVFSLSSRNTTTQPRIKVWYMN